MAAIKHSSPINRNSDRLAWTLLIAAAAHAVIILGVTFNPLEFADEHNLMPTLDITLIRKKTSAPPPDDADYFAESNQEGGGNTREKTVPQEETTQASSSPPVATSEAVKTQIIARKNITDAALPEKTPLPEEPQTPEVSASEMINRSLEMLSLNQQINQSRKIYSDRPRQKNITSRTRELKYAAYMQNWVSKVERVGDLNYPDSAKRQKLSGSLIVDVGIFPDGSIKDIRVVRPSGHKILDDAAVRIVRLAAPFATFPDNIREEFDELHIIRTWVFSSNQLKGR
ncbi:MAG: TonB family protein [Gammaproteobacteria bacterium]